MLFRSEKLKRVLSADQTGRFPTASAEGHPALLAMLGSGSSCAGAGPTKGNPGGELMRAWVRCCKDLRQADFHAVLQRIDSEISKRMIAHIEESGIEIEIAALACSLARPLASSLPALQRGRVLPVPSARSQH